MTKVSLTLPLLIFSVLSPLIHGQSTDCPLSSDIDVVGDGTLFLRQVINPSTSTVSVELEYMGIGWVGIAFSETTLMVPNTAVIGLPDTSSVQKYDLSSRDISGVVPVSSERQTLTDASVTQDGTSTILRFTKPLIESDETAVVAGSNMINVAYGSSNTLGIHLFRLPTTATFTECAVAAPVATPTDAPVAAPVAATTDAPVAAPTDAPVEAPVDAPVDAPVEAPVEVPTEGDGSTSDAPSAAPVFVSEPAPNVGGGYTPVAAPTTAKAPTSANVTAPVKAPVKAPAPTSAGTAMTTQWMIVTTTMMMGCVMGASWMFAL